MVTAGRNLSVWGQWFSCFTTSTNDVCSAQDLAAVNLRCSLGLNESIDHLYLECLELVAEWSCQLIEFTERNHHHFREDPGYFEHSEEVFQAIAMVQFVQDALRVRYNTMFAEGEYNAMDSRNLFLTGVLTGFGGTCVSLPVLYAALAQRIGYPVELAHTWEHYYCVWNSQSGFCFEAAGRGFDKRTHEYYRHFRRIVTAEDESTFGFLRPLSRKELFACFAKERSHCLQEQFRFDEALEADYLAKT
ncbi:MAG: transglutaminase family protein, partial [Planctomycetota bacterium]